MTEDDRETVAPERRTARLAVRFTPAGAKVIDRARGNWERSEFVRRAVAYAIKAGFRGPNSPEGDVL